MGIHKREFFVLVLVSILSGCAATKGNVRGVDITSKSFLASKTLKSILKEFFQENTIYIYEEQSKDNVAIDKLWQRLGIKQEEVSWKEKVSQEVHPLFDMFKYGITSLHYRTYTSHIATSIQDEYVIFELSQFNSEYQLLLFQKKGENSWVYVTNMMLNNNGGWQLDLQFYNTPDNSLLFSITETGSHGEENFSNYWVFYKLVEGKLKPVLTTLKSGYYEGWGISFKREYSAEMWPYFYSKPAIGFTYYIKYQGDSESYDSRFKNSTRLFDLFILRRDVLFVWNDKSKQYAIEKKRSQLSSNEIESIFNDGEKGFYEKYKWRVKFIKFFGNDRQKEWARAFERKIIGKD
ncbi:MAG: hypothetical protein WCI77_01985 [Candidatus Omnitrophota bacterium]